MDDYLSEKEQIEQIRRWWSENGRFVIAGLILGLAALYGWRAWGSYQDQHRVEASSSYAQLLVAIEQRNQDQAEQIASRLSTEYKDTPYAAQAAMGLARLYVESDKPEQAAEQLRIVMKSGDDPEMISLARLRLARVLLFQQRAQEALDLLDSGKAGRFAPLYHEARGDALHAMGNRSKAIEQYELALAASDAIAQDSAWLQMKIDDLAIATDDEMQAESGS